ncbi:NACHT domain-containing protein, partial [Actinospica durhamensis]
GGDGAPSAGDQAVVLDAYLRWVVATHRDARALIAGYPVDAPLAQMPWTGSVHSDGSTRYGRNQEVDYLHSHIAETSAEVSAQARVEALAGRPLPTYVGPAAHPDRVDPSAPAGEESEPAAELVARTWRCVILGDPGSGKTTLVRRFALEHAQRGLARDASVWRLPVLCRAADLVPALASAPQGVHALARTAVAVGWSAPSRPAAPADPVSGDRIPVAALADLARHAAAQGRLLLIVDGLDEVATFEERARLVERLNALVAAEGQRFDEPGRVRGNQIFVTSRLIGYHATPMAEAVRQVVLERISAEETLATGRFWLAHHTRATGRGPVAAAAARDLLDRLLGPGGDENARALAGLAANPYLLVSLVSAVASGAWARRGPQSHPVARGDLYEFMIGDAVARGEARFPGVAGELLLDLHAALGYLIHRTSPTGILAPAVLEARAGEALALQDAQRTADTGPAQALRYVRELGLLADRGQQLYGFLHLTLEEYLAGRWLVRAGDPAQTAARIEPHLGDPRWVEPIRLGLGYLSRADGPRFDAALTSLLTGPGGEHAIGLLAAGLIELSGVRPAHLEAAVEAVLELETQRLTRGDDQATAARLLLPLLAAPLLAGAGEDGAGTERAADLASRAVAHAVEHGTQWRLAAAARVAQALRLHDPRVVEALMRAQLRDGARYGWAVVRALQAMCVLADASLRGVEPGANQSAAEVLAGFDQETRDRLTWVDLVPGSVAGIALPSRAPIPAPLVPMRAGLDEALLARLATGPVALVRLILCLYGGTVFLDWWRWDAERTRLKSVLDVTDTPHATAHAAAVYLDTVVTPALSGPTTGLGSGKDLTVLWPAHITVDSPLTARLLDWLNAGESPEIIAERLRVLALDPAADPALRGDAAAGLIALGTRTAADSLAAVHTALPEAAATRLAWRLERARLLLGDEVPTFNLGAMLTSYYWTEYDATWDDISEAYLAMLQAIRRLEHEGLPAGGGFVWYSTIQEALVTLLCASLNLDDHLYSVAVILDTTGQSLMRHGPENLAEVLATAHLAAVAHEGRTTSWELDSLA